MSSGDTLFYNVVLPPVLSYFNQETFGILEIDACGRNALSCHGDILLDGKITTTDSWSPALYFNGSTINASGILSLNSGVWFSNVSSVDGIPFCPIQPQIAPEPWSVSGTVYVSEVLSALGTGNVKALCIS